MSQQARSAGLWGALVTVCLFLFPTLSCAESPSVSIYAKAAPYTVLLKTIGTMYNGEEEISWGSGFIVEDTGLVLTCSHVIPQDNLYKTTKRLAFMGNQDIENEAGADGFELIERDEGNDLALVRLSTSRPKPPLPIGDSDGIKVGEKLYILGFPLNYTVSLVEGIIGNNNVENHRWLTQAPLNPGNSGGPAFNDKGAVVAVAVGGIPKIRITTGHNSHEEVSVTGINHLIPIDAAKKKLLATLSISSGQLVFGAVPATPSLVHMSYSINEVNNRHPKLLGEHTESYEIVLQPEPRYKFSQAALAEISATRVSNKRLTISDDGKSAKLKFDLTSGPMVDQYRGWLDATINTKQIFCGEAC